MPKEPKEYKFRIQKKDSDGGFSIKEAGFKFRIKNEETGKYLSVSAKGGKDYKEDKSVFTTGPDGKKMIIAVFQEQIKCVKKKKTIEFCQAAANRGRSVNQTELREFIEKRDREVPGQS